MKGEVTPELALNLTAKGAISDGRSISAIANSEIAFNRSNFKGSDSLSGHDSNNRTKAEMSITDDRAIGARVPLFTMAWERRVMRGSLRGLDASHISYRADRAADMQRKAEWGRSDELHCVTKKSATIAASDGGKIKSRFRQNSRN